MAVVVGLYVLAELAQHRWLMAIGLLLSIAATAYFTWAAAYFDKILKTATAPATAAAKRKPFGRFRLVWLFAIYPFYRLLLPIICLGLLLCFAGNLFPGRLFAARSVTPLAVQLFVAQTFAGELTQGKFVPHITTLSFQPGNLTSGCEFAISWFCLAVIAAMLWSWLRLLAALPKANKQSVAEKVEAGTVFLVIPPPQPVCLRFQVKWNWPRVAWQAAACLAVLALAYYARTPWLYSVGLAASVAGAAFFFREIWRCPDCLSRMRKEAAAARKRGAPVGADFTSADLMKLLANPLYLCIMLFACLALTLFYADRLFAGLLFEANTASPFSFAAFAVQAVATEVSFGHWNVYLSDVTVASGWALGRLSFAVSLACALALIRVCTAYVLALTLLASTPKWRDIKPEAPLPPARLPAPLPKPKS
jgi:hypothetical protein